MISKGNLYLRFDIKYFCELLKIKLFDPRSHPRMTLKDYKLVISLKVKFFNFFRKVFIYSFFENLLLIKIIGSPTSSFWRKFIPPNYLYPRSSNRNCVRNNRRFKLDISTVYEHFVYYDYPEQHFKLARQFFTPNMIIFDVGANIGAAALYFDANAPDCEVHAFEPYPRTFFRAKKNFSINKEANIILNNFGLGDKISEHMIYELNERNPGMNRILPNIHDKEINGSPVKVDTLTNYFNSCGLDTLSLIKIDVEGFEMKVVQGAVETIKKYKPLMLVEIVNENLLEVGDSAAALVTLLSELGYSIIRIDDRTEINSEMSFDQCHFDVICLPNGLKLSE